MRRVRTTHKREVSRTAALLADLLPDQPGRTSAERLQAITGKAFVDALPRIETRLTRALSDDERADLKASLIVSGIECVERYDEARDRGTGTVPVDVRFGRFVYLRSRLKAIDWERKQFGDRRPGRTRPPTEFARYDDEAEVEHEVSLDEVAASRLQVETWTRAASFAGVPVGTWISTTLDAAARRGSP